MTDPYDYPGRLSIPIVNVEGFNFPSQAEWAHRYRVAQARQEKYNRSVKGRILNVIRYFRGRLAAWIAPEGFFND